MMGMEDFTWFRSTETGKIGKYPRRFASRPTLEEIDPNEAQCVDCWVRADDEELTDTETDTFGLGDYVLDEDRNEDD